MIPNNVADLIKASQDNREGVFDTVSIDDLVVDCLVSLEAPSSLDIVEKRFQDGLSKVDVAVEEINNLTMEIVFTNPELSLDNVAEAYAKDDFGKFNDSFVDKKKRLYEIFNNREIISTQTHDEIYPDGMIQSIEPLYDSEENEEAFICMVVIKRMRIFGKEEESGTGFFAEKKGVSL